MGRLSDILQNGDADRLRRSWETSQAAGDFAPLPGGDYLADITKGELKTSRANRTPGFKLEFTIAEGEFAGRKVWHDCWLTEAAMPQAKRDLTKLGVTSLDQLEKPLPPGIRCKLRVAIRRDDNGNECNRVKSFDVVAVNVPKADPFSPSGSTGNDSQAGSLSHGGPAT